MTGKTSAPNHRRRDRPNSTGLGLQNRFSTNDSLEPVPEKCGRFSDKNMLKLKGIEHFR